MLYAIIGEDVPDSMEKRLPESAEHLARVVELQKQGRLVLGGPFPAIDSCDPGPAGVTGSLIVAQFASLEEAKSWAAADPYTTAGVFAKVTVKPFKKVMP
jgi:uncharacterized protein